MTSVFDAPCGSEGHAAPATAEQWFGPNGHRLLSWEVDFRSGGAARLQVRSPEGSDHWVEGVRLEIAEPERVVFSGDLGFAGPTVTFHRA
jgi:uncharacterized protein YndB with AHSA1/START domain